MNWSFTESKMFLKCQRKWYYFSIVANPNSKDSVRREAFLLKQLQSISAWRGSLVDTVIQKSIIPKIKYHAFPSENVVLEYATQLINKQLAFGKEKKYLEISKTNAEDAYCAFYELEYEGRLDDEKLQKARDEIITSLKNLLRSDLIKEIAIDNSYIICQRELTFPFEEDVNVSCTPDMIVFFKDKPPLIVDWKVHLFGNTDAWLQLGIYALALLKTKPHKDFPQDAYKVKNSSDIRLIEYQLLKNVQREYSISSEDLNDIEDYIFRSSMQMKKLINGAKKYNRIDINRFKTARSPVVCEKCQFRKLCWREVPVQKRLLEE